MNFALIGFIFFLVIILVVGFITFNISESHKDFFIAGRKLNPWLLACSERASGERVCFPAVWITSLLTDKR